MPRTERVDAAHRLLQALNEVGLDSADPYWRRQVMEQYTAIVENPTFRSTQFYMIAALVQRIVMAALNVNHGERVTSGEQWSEASRKIAAAVAAANESPTS